MCTCARVFTHVCAYRSDFGSTCIVHVCSNRFRIVFMSWFRRLAPAAFSTDDVNLAIGVLEKEGVHSTALFTSLTEDDVVSIADDVTKNMLSHVWRVASQQRDASIKGSCLAAAADARSRPAVTPVACSRFPSSLRGFRSAEALAMRALVGAAADRAAPSVAGTLAESISAEMNHAAKRCHSVVMRYAPSAKRLRLVSASGTEEALS